MPSTTITSGVQYSGIWTMQQVNAAIAAGTWTVPAGPGFATYWAWGKGANGELGFGNTTSYSSPKQVGSLNNWLTLAGAYRQTYGIKTNGTLWSWGTNSSYQLGLGNTTYYSSPKQVGSGTTWASVTSGRNHALALKSDGTLWGWGYNGQGQAWGDGTTSGGVSPKQIGALSNWTSIAAGSNHSLGVSGGKLYLWGRNQAGQLGLGNTTYYSSPKQIGAGTDWASVGSASNASYAIKTDSTLWSWGSNGYGELGSGTTTYRSSPVQVGALTNWLKIVGNVSGNGVNTYAIKTDGTLWAWGTNNGGALGDGTETNRSSPVQIGALTNWLNVAAGLYFGLAVKTTNTLWSWGKNTNGNLGFGNTTNYSSPKQIGSLANWLNVAAGYYNSRATQSA